MIKIKGLSSPTSKFKCHLICHLACEAPIGPISQSQGPGEVDITGFGHFAVIHRVQQSRTRPVQVSSHRSFSAKFPALSQAQFSSRLDPRSDHRPLLKCKLIKVKPSSLKLNHFKLDWLSLSLPPLHFSFPSLAHPHFRETICHSCEIAPICITDASFGLCLFPWPWCARQRYNERAELLTPLRFGRSRLTVKARSFSWLRFLSG